MKGRRGRRVHANQSWGPAGAHAPLARRRQRKIRPMASLVPLVETSRGGTLENVHFGALAVADTAGGVLAQCR